MRGPLASWPVTLLECLDDAVPDAHEAIRWRDKAGPLVISYVSVPVPGRYRLRLGKELVVDLLPDRQAVVRARQWVSSDAIEHFLADQVLPRVLAHEGTLVLHAGAVRIGDRAILFMGDSGRGKSTLTSSFDQAGHDLLGDDAMAISWGDGGPGAQAVYPSLRLQPDSIDALFNRPVVTTSVAHYSPKQRIDIPPAGADDAPLAIGAIFSIGEPRDDARIEVRRLTATEACMTFVASSFALDPSDVECARSRMSEASALANHRPVFEISYPRDYARLPDVRQAIFDQISIQDDTDGVA